MLICVNPKEYKLTKYKRYEKVGEAENRIIITPQFRATSSSTERVCDHILSSFEEGDIKDFQEVAYAK